MTVTAEPAVRMGKRARAKEANRRAILDAARVVFARIGYEAANIRDIIRETNLASGTFYNYFKSKEEVFEAIANDSRIHAILEGEAPSAGDRVNLEFKQSQTRLYKDGWLASTPGEGVQ